MGARQRQAAASGTLASADIGSPKTDYYLYDGLGSVKALVDSHGNQVARYSYDEWGVPEPGSNFKRAGHPNTYGFTGEDWDPDTELLYLRARYYSPALGRFATGDPFPGILKHPLSQNVYAYCYNNPINLVDAIGLGQNVWHWERGGPTTLIDIVLGFTSFIADVAGLFFPKAFVVSVASDVGATVYTGTRMYYGRATVLDMSVTLVGWIPVVGSGIVVVYAVAGTTKESFLVVW